MKVEQARFNMIEQQIRPWEVLDQRVLEVLTEVPREQFVPAEFRRLAFADMCIPLGAGEFMMAPKVEARMLQALAIEPKDRILEIGTGSGYVTALLARLGSQVTTLEINPEFAQQAEVLLGRQGFTNVRLVVGDGFETHDSGGPYDVIAVTGSVPILTEHFQQQLTLKGRLFIVVGQSPIMDARLITRAGPSAWTSESLFETDLPQLRGAPQPQRFVF
ncbi:MAG: protein-L-isoaspartate O-methyltransferase [Nitrososphaera sp.]|nr:protein-L-isoaspartate O-methyltransferase [Nitrososphaera sp.]